MRRREVPIRHPFFENRPRCLAVQIDALGLFVLLIPIQAQPLQSFKNRIDRSLRVALDICIVQAQDHCSAVVPGVEPIEDESASAAHV